MDVTYITWLDPSETKHCNGINLFANWLNHHGNIVAEALASALKKMIRSGTYSSKPSPAIGDSGRKRKGVRW